MVILLLITLLTVVKFSYEIMKVKRIKTKVPIASDNSSFILLNGIINDVKL